MPREVTPVLTDTLIKSLKLPPGKAQLKKFDTGGIPGLHFLLTPGAAGWRLRYYYQGKEKLLSLGAWPETTLKQAREKATALREQLAEGTDPSMQRKVDVALRVESAKQTFGPVGLELLALDDVKSPRTKSKHEWVFKLLRPLHSRPIRELRTPEIVKVLRGIEAHMDRRETAHRAAMWANRICRYAVQMGFAETNPAADLRGALKPLKIESHPAITEPAQVAEMLAKIWAYDLIGAPSVAVALKMCAYTLVRPGELREAEWSEIDFAKRVADPERAHEDAPPARRAPRAPGGGPAQGSAEPNRQ